MKQPKYKQLRCCCCGGAAYGLQHWNQDTGYGLGDCCVDFCKRGTSDSEFERTYGKEGINFLVNKDSDETK